MALPNAEIGIYFSEGTKGFQLKGQFRNCNVLRAAPAAKISNVLGTLGPTFCLICRLPTISITGKLKANR